MSVAADVLLRPRVRVAPPSECECGNGLRPSALRERVTEAIGTDGKYIHPVSRHGRLNQIDRKFDFDCWRDGGPLCLVFVVVPGQIGVR